MPRLSALFLIFLLGAASALALVACGGGEDANLLPGTTADQIESNLDEVEQLASARDCIGAEGAVAEVAAEVEELQNVDLKLKAALQEGTRKLSEVVGRCEEEEEETSEEPEPTLETDVESDEVEDDEKPKKQDKPDKAEEPTEPTEGSEPEAGVELPPQAKGKGEEKAGGETAPPVAPEPEAAPPSGGVGPSQGVE